MKYYRNNIVPRGMILHQYKYQPYPKAILITSDQNRSTLTTYLQKDTSVHTELRKHDDPVDSL